jgi:transcriptional regulator with XRE-family HTH domain
MDAQKFGCFVAERRKELNMTQKDLAAKIQVTDKAVSKWERGLGFPDINTIEVLAEALDVSITELMKSERLNENALMEEPVDNVIQVAKADIEERHKIIIYTFAATTVLLTVLEILLSIEWNADKLQLKAGIPWMAIIPGILMIFYGIVCKIRGKKSFGAPAIGVCMLLVPIILIGGTFLIMGMVTDAGVIKGNATTESEGTAAGSMASERGYVYYSEITPEDWEVIDYVNKNSNYGFSLMEKMDENTCFQYMDVPNLYGEDRPDMLIDSQGTKIFSENAIFRYMISLRKPSDYHILGIHQGDTYQQAKELAEAAGFVWTDESGLYGNRTETTYSKGNVSIVVCTNNSKSKDKSNDTIDSLRVYVPLRDESYEPIDGDY